MSLEIPTNRNWTPSEKLAYCQGVIAAMEDQDSNVSADIRLILERLSRISAFDQLHEIVRPISPRVAAELYLAATDQKMKEVGKETERAAAAFIQDQPEPDDCYAFCQFMAIIRPYMEDARP